MPRIRFSIASFMGVIIFVAVGIAALQSATQLWVNIVFNLVVALLLVATYKAKCAQGIAGAWWAGFAAFGWVHLVLGVAGPPWGNQYEVRLTVFTEEIFFWVV